ncbi:hypothetical protein OG203_36495 [Nocardia sp. NBC_01499]|uniref:hypothetical protein n=1 Tax=Nocardia sp. NBC_01499 TaxID=2903597 RepID=UPI0038694C14
MRHLHWIFFPSHPRRIPESPSCCGQRTRPMRAATAEGMCGFGCARDSRPAGTYAAGQCAQPSLYPLAFVLS